MEPDYYDEFGEPIYESHLQPNEGVVSDYVREMADEISQMPDEEILDALDLLMQVKTVLEGEPGGCTGKPKQD